MEGRAAASNHTYYAGLSPRSISKSTALLCPLRQAELDFEEFHAATIQFRVLNANTSAKIEVLG